MSIKSTALVCACLLISSLPNMTWAGYWVDYDSPGVAADEELATNQSYHDMAPLLEGVIEKPSLTENPTISKEQFIKELKGIAEQEEIQKFLDSESFGTYTESLDNAFTQNDTLIDMFSQMTKSEPEQENTASSFNMPILTKNDAQNALQSRSLKDEFLQEMKKLDPLALSTTE